MIRQTLDDAKLPRMNLNLVLTLSSDPSGQSSSPSQRHFAVTQYFSEHWNCLMGSHFAGVHLASSDPSPQSSSRSHTHRLWMQRPLLQVNSSERQVSSVKSQESLKCASKLRENSVSRESFQSREFSIETLCFRAPQTISLGNKIQNYAKSAFQALAPRWKNENSKSISGWFT